MRTRIAYIVMLLVGVVTSCTLEEFDPNAWAIEPHLETSFSGRIYNAYNTIDTLLVSTNYDNFVVVSNEPEWCKVQANIAQHQIIIIVKENETSEQRYATISISITRGNKSLTKDISIYQYGGKWDMVEGTDIKLRWSYDVSESQKNIIRKQISELVYVKGGTFLMGAQNDNLEMDNYFKYAQEENPVHKVTLSDYYIGKYEITQEQWTAIMGSNPSFCEGAHKPVENVSWEEIQSYVERLSKLTGLVFSLPTSAQWEFAARGGVYSKGFLYSGSNNYEDVGYFQHIYTDDGYIDDSSPYFTTAEVGTKQPNELGIYDMTGNVEEVCLDWYGIVPSADQHDPIGPNFGTYHVSRGGLFYNSQIEKFCTNFSVVPFIYLEKNRGNFGGFRIVMKRWVI